MAGARLHLKLYSWQINPITLVALRCCRCWGLPDGAQHPGVNGSKDEQAYTLAVGNSILSQLHLCLTVSLCGLTLKCEDTHSYIGIHPMLYPD